MKLLLTLLSLSLCVTPLSAQDLTKVDRTIRKEPAYESKAPKYCLLVFGPEAKHRVWLVQDGDTLYIDRNGNGDLTNTGEKVARSKDAGAKEGPCVFEVGDLPEGKLLHKDFRIEVSKLKLKGDGEELLQQHLAKHPQAPAYAVMLAVEMPGWQSIGEGKRLYQIAISFDHLGVLAWSDRPATAPVLHFRGPWHLVPFGSPPKLTGGRPEDFVLSLGTPGVGPGTTVYTAYEGVVPEKKYPKVEITYPPAPPGAPQKELYELKERC
jgi:hypothetical protein